MKKALSLALCVILCVCMSTIFVHAADGTAQYANDKPVIDGLIDEVWSTTQAFENTYPGDADGEGISGYAKILWDEDYFYILAVVNDATVDASVNASSDSVDLWVSETNSGDPNGFNAEGDYALTVTPAGLSSEFYYIGNEAVYSNSECVTTLTDSGYIVEVKVDYQTAGLVPATGHIIGFNISFNNDLDNDGGRDSWNSWQAYDGRPYWANTSVLNTVEFIGEKIETTAPETEAPAPETAATTETTTTPAAQTFDVIAIASVISIISLAGVAISKKH